MKRALLSQIKNDWKENIWLIVELLIVSLIILYLTLTIIRSYKDFHLPMGADITGVYGAQINFLDDKGEPLYFFEPEELEPEVMSRLQVSQQALLDRVKEMPSVEYAALGNNALPYTFSFYGNLLRLKWGKDTISQSVNTRTMTPEGVEVLQLQSRTGKTRPQLKKMLEMDQVLVGPGLNVDFYWGESGYKPEQLLEEELMEPFVGYRVGDLINAVRRSNYEPHYNSGTLIKPVQENTPQILTLNSLMARVKPGQEKAFEKAMLSEPTLKATIGVALSKFHPISEDVITTGWGTGVQQRTYLAGIIFLLLIIFIGLLGTFWYRVYLRTPEIAVRKTFGATDGDIFRRFLSEAMLLLLGAFILAAGMWFGLIGRLKDNYLTSVCFYPSWKWDVALAALITAAVMSIMILIGVGIPARRAMKIQPAIALKEE